MTAFSPGQSPPPVSIPTFIALLLNEYEPCSGWRYRCGYTSSHLVYVTEHSDYHEKRLPRVTREPRAGDVFCGMIELCRLVMRCLAAPQKTRRNGAPGVSPGRDRDCARALDSPQYQPKFVRPI